MENEKINGCAGCEGDCSDCAEFENIVEFEDGEGNVIQFAIEDWTEYEGTRYVGLVCVDGNEYFDSDSMVIAYLDDEKEELLPVEDDELAEKVFAQMMEERNFEALEGEDA